MNVYVFVARSPIDRRSWGGSAGLSHWLSLLGTALLAALCASLASGADLLQVKDAAVGFGSKFKPGFWQPVRLTIVAGAAAVRGKLEVVVPDGDQTPAVYHDAARVEIDLAPGEERSLLLYGKSGPIDVPFEVRLVNAAGVAWSQAIESQRPTLRSTQGLIVGVGPPIGLAEAVNSIRRRADNPPETVSVRAARDLPDRWWGYDGVDVLVLATSDAKLLASMSDEQQQSIVEWVLQGGRLVLCVGARGAELTDPANPFSTLIPGELVEVDPLRERSGLEAFTKVELPFNDPLFQRNRPLVTRLRKVRDEVLLDEGGSAAGRPLALHAAVGFGQVVFLGLDLDHAALAGWKGRTRLLAGLLQRAAAEREASEREAHHAVTTLGYDDLAGQLRAALEQFPDVWLVNFTTVSVLTIAYLLLIGPGDFLFLSRLALPRHLTWLTLPLVAVATITVAGIMNRQVHGNRVRLNQVEIVDVDLARQLTRGHAWCHLFSPATRAFSTRLQIAAPPGVAASPIHGWLDWQGLPGDALGGLESRQPTLARREPYFVAAAGDAPAIDGLTVQVASSKSLSAYWSSKSNLAADTKLSIDRYGLLTGEFTQPLDIALEECILVHGEKLYRLGTLRGGEKVQIADLPPLNLEARLTQRRVEQSKDVSTPWEKDSVDVPRIVQMLMFHEAARGQSYTGLTHRYQPKIDLSELARLGHAILVGRAEKPVARLLMGDSGSPLVADEDTRTWTWYRIVFPVNR
jgi:hypothetical protein